MKGFIIIFVLLSIFIFPFACFGQWDVWERSPEYEVLPDGSIFIGGRPYTEEEQAEMEAERNRDSLNNSSDDSYYSYSVLGTRTNMSELLKSGYTQVGSDTWTFIVADNIDGYIWLEKDVIITEGFVFHDINPNLTHDVVADMIIDLFENGHIRKITKCTSSNSSSVCKSLQENLGSFISFPVTVFKTDFSYVQCYLTQTTIFSNNKENQFFYVCAL